VSKKNLLIYYPSFERGGVEENLKNLINTFSTKNYNLAIKKNNISKKYLNRFLMFDRSKDYEKLLTKFENK